MRGSETDLSDRVGDNKGKANMICKVQCQYTHSETFLIEHHSIWAASQDEITM